MLKLKESLIIEEAYQTLVIIFNLEKNIRFKENCNDSFHFNYILIRFDQKKKIRDIAYTQNRDNKQQIK